MASSNKKFEYELILCIVNEGFADTVMEVAKEAGASGGTILNARGTANKEAEAFFHITIQPEKEILMVLAPTEIKDAILHAIYRKAGLGTTSPGIAFSLPVDNVAGFFKRTQNDKAEQKPAPSAKN